MHTGAISPLLEGDLEGAAYLCLAAASLTDLDQFPPGSGSIACRMLHARKRRFEEAQALVRNGTTALSDLGLSHEDCAWAASKAEMARDQEGWLSRFQAAENALRNS
jgi:hypothetical protein